MSDCDSEVRTPNPDRCQQNKIPKLNASGFFLVQAARSGKQNIVEGNADMNTSIEMGIKLLNVAKGSLKELLSDYEDYLRVNQHRQWEESSVEFVAMRKLGKSADNAYILSIAKTRSLDVVANMAIILIKHEDYLLHKLLE